MPVLLPFQGFHCSPSGIYIPGEEPPCELQGVAWNRDVQPALYVYRQTFRFPGESELSVREGVMGLLNRGEASVYPHEGTFADRVAACAFALDAGVTDPGSLLLWCNDPEEALGAHLRLPHPPADSVTDRFGCLHQIWPVTAPGNQQQLQSALEGKALFLADGHHRFAAGWNLATVQIRSGALRSLASHRLVLRTRGTRFPDLQPVTDIDRFLQAADSRCVVVTPGPVFQGFTLPARAQAQEMLQDATIRPVREMRQAIEAVKNREACMALLVSPYAVADLERRALEGKLLAPQSTDFFPKLAAGLVSFRH